MKKYWLILIISISFLGMIKQSFLFYVPQNWPKPVYDFSKNPLSETKVELGRHLFYEPRLSRNNKISCASCHSPYNAFTHIDHQLSHGIDDRIGIRNSPALMNLAWQNTFMWDGAIRHLDMQALAPISHPDEMGSSIDSVISKLQSRNRYKNLFSKAYGDSIVTGERVLKSISQFMLTLISANSKYDKVMRGESGINFTDVEQKGYSLFKIHCSSCHKEPLFTSGNFENNGLEPDATLKDIGRMKITRKNSDSLKFKIPSLRNCELTSPYMHDGRYRNLQMVLFHYTNAIYPSPTIAKQLKTKMVLSEIEKGCLIAFLKTLTDEDFVTNQKYTFPK